MSAVARYTHVFNLLEPEQKRLDALLKKDKKIIEIFIKGITAFEEEIKRERDKK